MRQRFEEYICAALSSIKFADFLTKGKAQDLTIVGVCQLTRDWSGTDADGLAGEGGVMQAFSEAWLSAFKETAAFERWNAVTDPALFDICEPK